MDALLKNGVVVATKQRLPNVAKVYEACNGRVVVDTYGRKKNQGFFCNLSTNCKNCKYIPLKFITM